MKLRLILITVLTIQANLAFSDILEELVVTATRSEQTVAEVSGNIASIDQRALEIVSHTHINESLARVPGAWISRGNGQEHLTALRSPVLTGAGACGAFLMLQDSIPLRATGFCNVNELFDANSEQARRIEVIKGPSGVAYGSNAMHGVINVLSPDLSPVRRLSLEGGPHEYARARFSVGSNAWRVDGNATTDGGYKDDSGFDQQKLLISNRLAAWNWQVTNRAALTNLNQETAGFILGKDTYKSARLRRANPNPEAYRDTRSARLSSQWQMQLTNGSELTLTPYVRHARMRFIQHYLPGQAIEDNGHDSLGIQTGWQYNDFRAGIDAEATRGFLNEYQPNPTAGSPFLAGTIPQGLHYDYDVDARVLAVFGDYVLSPSDAMTVTVGMRFERVMYSYDNKMLTGRTRDDGTNCGFGGCRFSRPADREDKFNNVSARAGISYSLSPGSRLFINLARGLRAPHTSELYRLQGSQAVSEIEAEQLDSLEIGLRGDVNRFSYDVSAYAMRKDNFIFRDTNRATVDNGETSHRGIELRAEFALTNSLSVAANWSWALHKYENNPALVASPVKGNDIDTAPRNLGSARLEWQPSEQVIAELEWVNLGSYYEDPENLHRYKGHDLVHLRTEVALDQRFTVFARITNLTDTKYAERADYSFGNDRYFVGEPRSLYLGITAEL
jgi:outer membrane receptor protein involved in Fe transport